MFNDKERKIRENDNYVGFLGCEFSNFYKSEFMVNGVKFDCVERGFMYCKSKLFGDEEISKRILESKDIVEVKRLGGKVRNFDEKLWNEKKEKYMFLLVLSKFSNNERLKEMLLNSGNKEIVECSVFDKEWGCGIGVDRFFENGCELKGKNKLGKVLMKVREELRKG